MSEPERVSMRVAYGEALVALGRQNPEVVVLSADVANSDHSHMFQEAFPDRFFNVGIAEQSLVDVAAGMAYAGKVPFANTFAFLFATRALEMIRTHLCYGKAPVKLMGAYAGLSDSFDGPTHHAVTDVAVMRSLPGMCVVVPSDPGSLKTLLPQVAQWPGPVYMRLNRNAVPCLPDADQYCPIMGKAERLRRGDDLTLVCNGIMAGRCLEAARLLSRQKIEARILEMHTVKPLDTKALLEAARQTGALVTAEEHSIVGGLGAAVAEAVSDHFPVPVKRVGIRDRFAETGPYDALLDRYGMSVDDIVAAAHKALAQKKNAKPRGGNS